ncbi:PPR repeat protein [Medicago truncatula]|uniref:PPR repeat protein n=1 Tax=Medicago truncatula TaxID=3880 RepID=A0A072U0A8_MEDTR|nr:PPR repeat protein [Medicago truncatula]
MFDDALATSRKVGTKLYCRPLDTDSNHKLISTFCEYGILSKAENQFQEMYSMTMYLDVPTHMSLIDACLKVNSIDDALRILNKMVDVGIKVDTPSSNRVFGKLIKNGKVMDCAHILSKVALKHVVLHTYVEATTLHCKSSKMKEIHATFIMFPLELHWVHQRI